MGTRLLDLDQLAAQQVRFGDRHLFGGLTRFVPPQVAALFDGVVPEAALDDASAPVAALPPIDIAARLRLSSGLFQ